MSVLDTVQNLYDVTTVVPGHGEVSDKTISFIDEEKEKN